MNNSNMPGRCTLQVMGTNQNQQKSAGGATRARDVERRLSKQGVHRGLNVHLDPVLLSQVQDE